MGACKAFISLYKVYMNHTTIVLLYKSLLLKQTVIFIINQFIINGYVAYNNRVLW